jgi:hypothetical protein
MHNASVEESHERGVASNQFGLIVSKKDASVRNNIIFSGRCFIGLLTTGWGFDA